MNRFKSLTLTAFLLSALFGMSSVAHAEKKSQPAGSNDDVPVTENSSAGTNDPSFSPTPAPSESRLASAGEADRVFKVYAGIDFGHNGLSSVPAGEQTKSGYLFDVKAAGSLYIPHWDFDLGLGYFSSNVSSTVKNLRIVTNGFLIAIDPQYRIIPNFQVGPVFNALIGSDVSFSENSDSSSIKVLGGMGAKYKFPLGSYDLRLVAQGLTSLSGTSRNVWTVQGGVQIGFSVADH